MLTPNPCTPQTRRAGAYPAGDRGRRPPSEPGQAAGRATRTWTGSSRFGVRREDNLYSRFGSACCAAVTRSAPCPPRPRARRAALRSPLRARTSSGHRLKEPGRPLLYSVVMSSSAPTERAAIASTSSSRNRGTPGRESSFSGRSRLRRWEPSPRSREVVLGARPPDQPAHRPSDQRRPAGPRGLHVPATRVSRGMCSLCRSGGRVTTSPVTFRRTRPICSSLRPPLPDRARARDTFVQIPVTPQQTPRFLPCGRGDAFGRATSRSPHSCRGRCVFA